MFRAALILFFAICTLSLSLTSANATPLADGLETTANALKGSLVLSEQRNMSMGHHRDIWMPKQASLTNRSAPDKCLVHAELDCGQHGSHTCPEHSSTNIVELVLVLAENICKPPSTQMKLLATSSPTHRRPPKLSPC